MKIIAESAFNHSGDLEYLKSLARAAKEQGAELFTVQIMDPDAFCVPDYAKYEIYQENSFTPAQWKEVFKLCEELKINLLPCPLDGASLDLCLEAGYSRVKVHATDIGNFPFLEKLAEKGVSVLLETQCATNLDIKVAFEKLGDSLEALFHGFSNYPTEVEELNLNALDALKTDYGHPVGFADHSLDTANIPLMALAKGCAYLEKHITLSRNDRGLDWQVSLYPEEFGAMVKNVRHYEHSLGKTVKHPVPHEKKFRSIMYKKVQDADASLFQRSDEGQPGLEHAFRRFSEERVGAAIIARLKSARLKRKVMKELQNEELIGDLYRRVARAEKLSDVALASSPLLDDRELVELFEERGRPVFQGHPVSVLDRLLEYAWENELGAVFRVTGDNPLTDPFLMDRMVEMMIENELDYVRVNGVPFGVSAELFRSTYLLDLYLGMEDIEESEYLTWFVIRDENARKGIIRVHPDRDGVDGVNLSVDHPEDLERVRQLIEKIGKDEFTEIGLKDILLNVDPEEASNLDLRIKLPQGNDMLLREYLNLLDRVDYIVSKDYRTDELPDR